MIICDCYIAINGAHHYSYLAAQIGDGFLQAFAGTRTTFKERLDVLLGGRSKQIWIMGHSLGGALATVSAQWLSTQGSSEYRSSAIHLARFVALRLVQWSGCISSYRMCAMVVRCTVCIQV